MMKLLILLVLYGCCDADPEDLTGKHLTIPNPMSGRDDLTSHIKVQVKVETPISAMTMCQRYFYSGRDQLPRVLFHLGNGEDNIWLTYGVGQYDQQYRLHIRGSVIDLPKLPDSGHRHQWNSLCWTWSLGLTQLWVNKERSGHHSVPKQQPIPAVEVTIRLGQEEIEGPGGSSKPGGGGIGGSSGSKGSKSGESFMGDVTDVHVWDSVLTPCVIKQYIRGTGVSPGNLLNWRALEYTPNGNVFITESGRCKADV